MATLIAGLVHNAFSGTSFMPGAVSLLLGRYLAELPSPAPDGLYYVGVYGQSLGILATGDRYSFTLQVNHQMN